MSVQANFADLHLRGMRDRRMWSGTKLRREICRLAAFLRLIYLINLDQYSPAIPTLRSQKINLNCPSFYFVTSIQFVACALRENLSNRSSGVQIPRDICNRFGRYLYSTKCSWIIRHLLYLPTQIRFLIGGERVTYHYSKLNDALGRTKLNDALGKQHLELWTCTWSGRASWNRGKFVSQQRQANNFNYK